MTSRQRNLIEQYLTREDREKLAAEFSMSLSSVRMKLKGERPLEDEFVLRAISLAGIRKRNRFVISQKLKSLAA